MSRSRRVDYDQIAHLYDSQPHRGRSVDPELLALMQQRASGTPIRIADIACGTGNQLVANRAAVPAARLVGVDRSIGMLRQAQPKAADIAWIHADAAALPLQSGSFNVVGCNFAFHHFDDKAGMLREAFRVLGSSGRLSLHNTCPEECPDWLYYEYFPEAWTIDQRDFWPVTKLVTVMQEIGFADVVTRYEHLRFGNDLADLLATVRRRDSCSQLQAIDDKNYAAGVRRLEAELAGPKLPQARADHLCLITVRGEKP